MLADGEPAWLLAWRHRQAQPQPIPTPVVAAPALPRPPAAPHNTFAFPAREGADLQGIIEPQRWDYDGCKRREPVLDADARPPRVVRKVGWQRCMKCRRPFFSEDVIRLRLCSGADGCREDEDRFR